MGGTNAVLERGQEAFAAGDYRWAAEVFNHVVFADPENKDARDWLSATYEQLGFQAESGAWRSYYLTGAAELRRGLPNVGNPQLGNADFLKAVPSIDLFDALAARFNPAKMKRDPYTVVFEFPDSGETVSLLVGDAVLVPREGSVSEPTATVTIDRFDFDRLILQEARPLGLITSGKMKISGNRGAVSAMSDIQTIETEALQAIDGAGDLAALDTVRVAELGKKGRVSGLMKTLGKMSPEERQEMGPKLNALKNRVADAVEARKAVLEDAALEAQLATEKLDMTLPPKPEHA